MAIELASHLSPERWVLLGEKLPVKDSEAIEMGMVVKVVGGETEPAASDDPVAGVSILRATITGDDSASPRPFTQFAPAKGNVFWAPNTDADASPTPGVAIDPDAGDTLDIDSDGTGLTADSNSDVTVVEFDAEKNRIYFVFNTIQELF